MAATRIRPTNARHVILMRVATSPDNSCVLAAWHPITHDFGLIQAPLEDVLASFLNWHSSLGTEYARTEITTSLEEAFQSLLPLANSKMRRLFVPTQSNWVACFQNGIQGSDPFPAMSYLARQMGVLAMRVCNTGPNVLYPATIWELYAPSSLGGDSLLGYRRSLSAANDGGKWVFDEAGEPFPFELVDRYRLRRKRDRFTSDMLRDYVAHFGIRLFDDEFLCVNVESPAIRLQQITNVWHTPEFTRDEVIEGKPWREIAAKRRQSVAVGVSIRTVPQRGNLRQPRPAAWGTGPIRPSQAPTGRDEWLATRHRSQAYRPFRAPAIQPFSFPRAMPWAGAGRPFGPLPCACRNRGQ